METKLHKINTIKKEERETANVPKTTESKEKTEKEENSLESILSEFKLCGRYHIKFYFLLSLPIILISPQTINYIFITDSVNHRCKYDNCDSIELSKLKQNSTVDYKCHKYELFDENGTCTEDNFNLSTATDCTEWIYDDPKSFVADFNLGCEDWKRTLVGTIRSMGNMAGLLLVSPMSDKIGRKKLIILCTVARSVIGLFKTILTSYWMYIAFEFIESIVGDNFGIIFTLAVEMVTKKDRPKIVFLLSIFVTTGQILLAFFAYLAPSWNMLLVCTYVPTVLIIPCVLWMDESVRWLLIKGKKEAAANILRRAIKTNGITVDDSRIANLNCEDSSTANTWTSIKVTLSSKKLLFRLFVCILMWFTSLFSSHSLLIISVTLEGNKYINFCLLALCGSVAGTVLYFVLPRFKRKGPLILFLTLTGVFSTAQAFVPTGYRWLSTLLYLCSKVSAVSSLRTSYLYTTELFPTYTRTTMIGLCLSISRTANIVAPQTPLLLKYWPGLPTLLIGILSLTTATVVTLMPDTSEDVLPDNVKQAETLGVKQKEICNTL